MIALPVRGRGQRRRAVGDREIGHRRDLLRTRRCADRHLAEEMTVEVGRPVRIVALVIVEHRQVGLRHVVEHAVDGGAGDKARCRPRRTGARARSAGSRGDSRPGAPRRACASPGSGRPSARGSCWSRRRSRSPEPRALLATCAGAPPAGQMIETFGAERRDCELRQPVADEAGRRAGCRAPAAKESAKRPSGAPVGVLVIAAGVGVEPGLALRSMRMIQRVMKL